MSSQLSSSYQEDDEYAYDDGGNSMTFIGMVVAHFILFLFVYFWLYPSDEPPRNAIMYKLGTDIKRCRRTGEPTRPTTRLSIREISYLSRRDPCRERKYELSDEEQKTLTVVSEGEINYLRQLSDLATDETMNYGSLIVKRGVPVPEEVKKEDKEQLENLEAAGVEDMFQLRRHKEPEKKNKKKKTKERQDVLDQLTRGESADRIPILGRIIPDRLGQSRKVKRTVSAMLVPERTQEPQPTLELDKTQERVVKKKASSRPTQKPSALEVNVKKKKSGTMKEKKQLTLREELSLARTMEETTKKQNTVSISSREPPPA